MATATHNPSRLNDLYRTKFVAELQKELGLVNVTRCQSLKKLSLTSV
jgi:hypothetical protein